VRTHALVASLALAFTACADSLGGLSATVDQSCIPDWPTECAAQDETGGTEAFDCLDTPELLEGETVEHSCIPAREDGSCPTVDESCLFDAFERRFLTSCTDCLQDDIRPLCPTETQPANACCYQVGIVEATCG
jgi:hypothetical protein